MPAIVERDHAPSVAGQRLDPERKHPVDRMGGRKPWTAGSARHGRRRSDFRRYRRGARARTGKNCSAAKGRTGAGQHDLAQCNIKAPPANSPDDGDTGLRSEPEGMAEWPTTSPAFPQPAGSRQGEGRRAQVHVHRRAAARSTIRTSSSTWARPPETICPVLLDPLSLRRIPARPRRPAECEYRPAA